MLALPSLAVTVPSPSSSSGSRALVVESRSTRTSFTIEKRVELRYGQIFGGSDTAGPTWRLNDSAIDLPADVVARYADGALAMGITGFTYNIVRRTANGTETEVPLWEVCRCRLCLERRNAALVPR
jgi:hypothetical protein